MSFLISANFNPVALLITSGYLPLANGYVSACGRQVRQAGTRAISFSRSGERRFTIFRFSQKTIIVQWPKLEAF